MTTLFQAFADQPGVAALVAAALVFGLLSSGIRRRRRAAPSLRRTLTAIRRTNIDARPVLNLSERRIHRDLSKIVGKSPGHTLLAQVSMGEFLCASGRTRARSRWQTAFNAFNAKRVDFLIVDADWHPCAVVEYQGSGHYKGNARTRDAIKRAVCARADIPFIEVASTGLTARQARDLRGLMAEGVAVAAE